MNKIIISLIIALIILSGSMIFILTNIISAEEKTPELKAYTYTKAICDDNNFCQDHIITCKGSALINNEPITGAFVQFPIKWKDPRSEKEINTFCK